jgi:hypothetical protein
MKFLVIITIALAILGFVMSNAAAGGAYVGAGIGNTFFSSDYEDALEEIKNIDENATAWKIFGGFNAARFIGVEGGYRSFGTVSSTISGDLFESKTTGWDIEALGRLEIAIVDIFAKAGLMYWKTDVTVFGREYDDSSTDFFWGLGAGVHLGPIGVRLEWESAETDTPDNLSMVSLSATLGF